MGFSETPLTKDVDPPLILLPGMAADGRLFRFQRAILPCLCTPAWIEPFDREPLTDYAQRFARSITPHGRCFVGGASFGGIVALARIPTLVSRHNVLAFRSSTRSSRLGCGTGSGMAVIWPRNSVGRAGSARRNAREPR
jgi:hypothetical protein